MLWQGKGMLLHDAMAGKGHAAGSYGREMTCYWKLWQGNGILWAKSPNPSAFKIHNLFIWAILKQKIKISKIIHVNDLKIKII